MVLIFSPSLEEGAVSEELAKITAIIEKSKGTITRTDIWGVKKLAYPINNMLFFGFLSSRRILG